jgi:hypothetical protein
VDGVAAMPSENAPPAPADVPSAFPQRTVRAGAGIIFEEDYAVALDTAFAEPGERSVGEITLGSGDAGFVLVGASPEWDFEINHTTFEMVDVKFTTPFEPGTYSDTITFESVMGAPDGSTTYYVAESVMEVVAFAPTLRITIGGGGDETAPGATPSAAGGTQIQPGGTYDLATIVDTTGGDTVVTLDIENLTQSYDLDGDGNPGNDTLDPALVSLSLSDYFGEGTVEWLTTPAQTFAMGDTGQLSFRLPGQPETWDATFGFFTDERGAAGDAASEYRFTVDGTSMALDVTRPIPEPTTLGAVALLLAVTPGARRWRRS